jgi:hypothetical protein
MALQDQDSFYINITSDANGDRYPNNKTSDFRVHLPETLHLDTQQWKVGLATIQYPCDINNIGPSVGTALYIWDGFTEHELEFPNWHCVSIANLIAFLNDAAALCLNPNGIQSGETTLRNRVQRAHTDDTADNNIPVPAKQSKAFQEQRHLQSIQIQAYEEKRDLIDIQLTDIARLDSLKIQNQVQDVVDIEEEEAEEDDDEEEQIIFGMRNKTHRRIRPIERHVQAFEARSTTTMDTTNTWHQKNFQQYTYTREPDYYPVIFSVDKLNRTEIACTSPIFDIGMSDSLRVILGLYEQHNFSLTRYQRRRKFHTTLRRHIGVLEGIQSQYVNPLAQEFYGKDPTIQHLLRIATVLDLNFRRLWLHVRLAKLCENPDSSVITAAAIKTILLEPLSKTWPKDDPVWAPYLDTAEFYQYVKDIQSCNTLKRDIMDNSLFGDEYTTPEFCGLVTAMFMLKTIYTEPLLGRPLFAQMPGQINPHEFMQIYLDIVRPEPFNGLMTSLLALVKTEGRPGETARYEATRIQYKSLAIKDISGLKVLILSPSGLPIPFQRGPVLIQLHFIRTQGSVQLY